MPGGDELLRRSVDEIVPEPERIGEGDHPMRDQVRKEAISSSVLELRSAPDKA